VQQETQRELLQAIANDEHRPMREREAARRELANPADQPKVQSPCRHRRNANTPMSQADEDGDLEQALTFNPNDGLTTQDRIEIQRGLPESSQLILNAIGNNCLLWLFTNNVADVPVLIDCVNRTGSSLVKAKALDTLHLISRHSPIESAKLQAQEFLNQLDNQSQENQ
jgi:hypothetical protein